MINLRHSYKSVAISLLFVMIMLIFRHGIFVKREGNVRVTGGQNNTQSARGEDPRGEAPRGSGPIRPRPGAAKGDQVYKFSPEGKPLMTLGKPGDAAEPDHFYQPNDVLVAPNGNTPAASVPRSDLTPARTVLASVSAVG